MHVRNLLNDDEAVSPVIGVILMVAITVILAAVIATFVLGLGDQISSTAPQASFSFDYDETLDGDADGASGDVDISLTDVGDNGALTIRHSSGNTIDRANLRIAATPGGSTAASATSFSTEVSAGESAVVGVDSDATVNVIWQSSDGADSATLGQWTGPDA